MPSRPRPPHARNSSDRALPVPSALKEASRDQGFLPIAMSDCNISREDIECSLIEPDSPDHVLETYFRQQLEQLYPDSSQAFAAVDGAEISNPGGAAAEQDQCENEREYDFRLFAKPLAPGPKPVGASSVPQRISLRSPSPADGKSGFKNGGRPAKYYFAGGTSPGLAEQYVQSAVSGEDIIEALKMRWVC